MKRYWYHCSSKFHGETFIADRRTPKHAGEKEPPVPRLCVASSIARCFSACLFSECKPVYCYRTIKKCNGITPKDVWDSLVTGERWLIPPVELTLVKTIPASEADSAQWLVREYHRATKNSSSLKVRVAQLAIAAEVLDPTNSSLRDITTRLCEIVKINPEEFLLERIGNAEHLA